LKSDLTNLRSSRGQCRATCRDRPRLKPS
jgi:hypothetical protein